MRTLLAKLFRDEAGFIVSAELVLIATLLILAMVVGLSEVALNINNELEDVGSAFGAMSQSFRLNGLGGHQGNSAGGNFHDGADFCGGANDIQPGSARGEQ